MNYKYRTFVNAEGETEVFRKQECRSTTLAAGITRDDITIQLDSVSDLYAGLLSEFSQGQYSKRYVIRELEVNAVGDGVTSSIKVPMYWRGNDIQVTVGGDPVTRIAVDNDGFVNFEFPPEAGAAINITVAITSILYPPLSGQPEIRQNSILLNVGADYNITQTAAGTTVEFISSINLGDNIVATVEYFRSAESNVVWVGNERVEFYGIDFESNSLLQCVRGTSGTSARGHTTGTKVWDGSERQSLTRAAQSGLYGFSEDDLRRERWGKPVIDFLAAPCVPPVGASYCTTIACDASPVGASYCTTIDCQQIDTAPGPPIST